MANGQKWFELSRLLQCNVSIAKDLDPCSRFKIPVVNFAKAASS